jgi:exosortase/archaeosortase family protein
MKRRRITPSASEANARAAPNPLWFVGRFLLFLVLGQVVIAWIPPIEGWAIQSTLGTLQFLSWCLRLPGGVNGDAFNVGSSTVEIVGECTPLMPTLVMAAAISAYPAPRRDQLLGILAGAAVLWVFNLLRIGSLVAVIAWRPRSFDFIHMYLWQTITLAMVLVIFLVWTRLQRPRGASA